MVNPLQLGDTLWIIDNYVALFNKYLLMKYQAHINLEVCSFVKSVKYIFKYVYKGQCAMMEVNHRQCIDNAKKKKEKKAG